MVISIVENSVDPDQLASQKPVDQDKHCFQKGIYPGLAWYRLIAWFSFLLILTVSYKLLPFFSAVRPFIKAMSDVYRNGYQSITLHKTFEN